MPANFDAGPAGNGRMSPPSTQAPTIAVTVTLFADLRRFMPRGADGPLRYTLPAGSTIADLLATIGIPHDADLTAGLDGELADRDARLHEGADIMLLSPMEGGSVREASRGDSGERYGGGAAHSRLPAVEVSSANEPSNGRHARDKCGGGDWGGARPLPPISKGKRR